MANEISALIEKMEAVLTRLERTLEVVKELDSIQRWDIVLTDDYFEFHETDKWDGPSDNVIMETDFNRMLEKISDR